MLRVPAKSRVAFIQTVLNERKHGRRETPKKLAMTLALANLPVAARLLRKVNRAQA